MYQSTKRKNSEKAAVKEILRQFFCIGKAAVQERPDTAADIEKSKRGDDMELLVTGEQMKALDHFTIQEMGVPSLVLMERAGLAVFEAMKKEKFPLDRTLILCGGGK